MLKKSSLMLAVLLLYSATQPLFAASRGDDTAWQISKVRADITKIGVGANAAVRVKLRNKTELRGYISEIGEEGFLLIDSSSKEGVTVDYGDVTKVKNPNHSFTSSLLFWIGAGAIATGALAGFAGAGL